MKVYILITDTGTISVVCKDKSEAEAYKSKVSEDIRDCFYIEEHEIL